MSEIKREDIVVWNENGINTNAWVRNGATAWFIREEEKQLPPERLFDLIKRTWAKGQGFWRCSDCGVEMRTEQVAGWPLFAGINCAECWTKHKEHLKKQREAGHVCRMCRQPFDNCCC